MINPKTLLPSRLAARLVIVIAALGTGLLLAGCGSSGSSTITVGNENSADNALIKSSSKTETTKTTSNTPTTPSKGPLAFKPVVKPPSGPAPKKLVIKDLLVGTGAEAKAGQKITVNYVGVLYHGGKEFDSSWKRNEPFPFTLGVGQVIKGWDKGIPGMKVGGRRELVIPAALAYGSKGSPPSIPPNEPLVFVVDDLGT